MTARHQFAIPLLTLLLIGCLPLLSVAQRFAYIDSEVILKKMPAYKDAEAELVSLTKQWEQEIQTKQAEVLSMRRKMEAELVLLTPEMKKEREAEILTKENDLKNRQAELFGYDGALFKKRSELMRPIQDKILAASRKVAKEKKINFIFDKASDLHMIYYDASYNYSDFVMEELGISTEQK
ncbi:MAG: OmpH family outer membrane protein [Cytophagales bacterium]|nr:MAG: OmpH family outer membrane protein [Cytophagales bacterium]TAF60186.1 MAG: OmpH family outer membrane protein [Cytophagales bacterium]